MGSVIDLTVNVGDHWTGMCDLGVSHSFLDATDVLDLVVLVGGWCFLFFGLAEEMASLTSGGMDG